MACGTAAPYDLAEVKKLYGRIKDGAGQGPANPTRETAAEIAELLAGPLEVEKEMASRPTGKQIRLATGFATHKVERYIVQESRKFDDWKIYDGEGKEVMFNSYHYGKNPLGDLDMLTGGVAEGEGDPHGIGEWKSYCRVVAGRWSGCNGETVREEIEDFCEDEDDGDCEIFAVKPSKTSSHRQHVVVDGERVLSVCRRSRFKTRSLPRSYAICDSKGKERYVISADFVDRSYQIRNMKGELVAALHKDAKMMLLDATFGIGSKMWLSIAPGVDNLMIISAIIALKQCGTHYVKDAINIGIEKIKNKLFTKAKEEAKEQIGGDGTADSGVDGASGDPGDGGGFFDILTDAFSAAVNGLGSLIPSDD